MPLCQFKKICVKIGESDSMATEKFRDRKFCLLLYPNEDENHKEALEIIKRSYDYASINHDSDLDEEGNLKKVHTHVVIRFNNPVWNSALAKDLGIEINYIQKCRSLERSLLYLIHYNEPDKFQYDVRKVQGSLKQKLKNYIKNSGKDESEKVLELLDYIDSCVGYLDEQDFVRYVAFNGLYDIYRRSTVTFIRALQKHNEPYDRARSYYDV